MKKLKQRKKVSKANTMVNFSSLQGADIKK